MWTKDYEGRGSCLQITTDDCFVLTGVIADQQNPEDDDILIFKTDSLGNTIWQKTYEIEGEYEYGEWIEETSDGGFIVIARSHGGSFLIKTDANGDTLGIAEKPVERQPELEVITGIGRRIVLQYKNRPAGFETEVYDASGRMVDRIRDKDSSGTIIWGDGFTTGVYFIKDVSENAGRTHKVVLIE